MYIKPALAALADLSGCRLDRVHARRPPRGVPLDMASSVSPTRGEQEMSAWSGRYESACSHPRLLFNPFGDPERDPRRPGDAHNADGWKGAPSPS